MKKKLKSLDICLLKTLKKNSLLITGLALFLSVSISPLKGMGTGSDHSDEKPLIFPIPMEVQINEGIVSIDDTTFIMVPENVSKSDDFLAELIFNELIDKYEQPISIVSKSAFSDKDKFILIGEITNPLVRNYCEINGLIPSLKVLGNEGYILSASGNDIVVAANSKNGALFGLESLCQIIHKEGANLSVPRLIVKDSPRYAFRGIKLYLPGRENISFFKRFIKDFVAYYKFNKIILELNANMRLVRHPELNIGTH